ncbi:MAG: hypothetical protein IJ410_02185 [Oscillospiraceae bacterium]|nr:hypothetical protein [Oscillospiraceae bacterium]
MKAFRKIAALVMTVIMAVSMAGCHFQVGVEDDGTQTHIVEGINKAGKYLVKKITSPTYGDETAIIALNRSTYIDYWHNRSELYEQGLDHVVQSNGSYLGKNGEIYYDGYPEVILAHTAVGVLADKASSTILTQGISYDEALMKGGILNKVEALTALECGKYEIYEKGDITRQDLIDFAMELQKADGSFGYDNMAADGVTKIKLTAAAVTSLALTEEAGDVESAVKAGVDYLLANITENATPDEITSTIIALNTAGISAMDVNGADLTQWLLKYQREDGSCTFDETAKKGNATDTAVVLLGLASQYRFNTGLSSVYDMRDVLGGTHNKLSPIWQRNMKMMTYFLYAAIVFLVGIYITSRVRIRKWKKMGIYDYERNCMLLPHEVEERDRKLAAEKAAAERARKEESDKEAE